MWIEEKIMTFRPSLSRSAAPFGLVKGEQRVCWEDEDVERDEKDERAHKIDELH
jgi:hypothetical protein